MKKYKTSLILVLVIISLISCNNIQNEKISFKQLDFGIYNISVPSNWNTFDQQGIDSKVSGFITDSNDTIFNSFGIHSRKFDDVVQVFSKMQIAKYDSLGLDTDNLVFSKTPDIDEAQGTFLNEFYYYDTIDSRPVKMRVPKKIGHGYIGVSFDSININNERFVIYASNLDTIEQFELLKAIKTIKIK